MKLDPETIDIGMEELEALVDGARHQTLNADAHRKLRGATWKRWERWHVCWQARTRRCGNCAKCC